MIPRHLMIGTAVMLAIAIGMARLCAAGQQESGSDRVRKLHAADRASGVRTDGADHAVCRL